MGRLKEYWGIYLLLLFFGAGLAGFFIFEKGEVELWLNQHSQWPADYFFKYWTYLGDGIILAFLVIYLVFIRYYYVILTLIVILFQTIVVQGIKRFIFPDLTRPATFFKNVPGIHYVEGIILNYQHSFPSGHSATAFSVATILTIVIKNKKLSVIWYAMAILVGISRVYLMQHFFMDIYFGALIGLAVTWFTYYLMEKSLLKSRKSLNNSILGNA